MKLSRFNIVIIIGFLAIVGVIIMQLFIINNAHKLAKKDTEDKIFFALQDVLEKLYKDNLTGLLVSNQVEKVSGNYFTVNVNYEFENTILEHYLISEFEKNNLDVDFEYAVYNCSSDKMVFSNHLYIINKGKYSVMEKIILVASLLIGFSFSTLVQNKD